MKTLKTEWIYRMACAKEVHINTEANWTHCVTHNLPSQRNSPLKTNYAAFQKQKTNNNFEIPSTSNY